MNWQSLRNLNFYSMKIIFAWLEDLPLSFSYSSNVFLSHEYVIAKLTTILCIVKDLAPLIPLYYYTLQVAS